MHYQLNKILSYLQENQNSSYFNRTKSYLEIGTHLSKNILAFDEETYDSSEFLNKLIKDGYVKKQLAHDAASEMLENDDELMDLFEYYDITKRGLKFINKGGYKPPKIKVVLTDDQKREKRRDKIDRYKLWHLRYIFLALILSAVYFVLRIFEIDLIQLTKDTIRWMLQ